MENVTEIVNFLDEYLRKIGRESIGAVEANALLDKAGLLKDNPQRPGLPLRNMLRKGELPHAYQVAGKGSEWVILFSTAKRPAEVKKDSAFRRVVDNMFGEENK